MRHRIITALVVAFGARFLWEKDDSSGQDFSHRKAWVIERLRELSEVFSISICAYANMSNHYHLVLHVDREGAVNIANQGRKA